MKRITSEQIQGIYEWIGSNVYTFDADYFTKKILPVFPKQPIRKSHVIQCADFSTIYATSDIHADFRKFVQIVKSLGFVKNEFDPYTDDIYNPDLIGNVQWTGPPNTLFLVIGDLVDGRRAYGKEDNNPDDPRGSFELLLLAFLYNLRISAIENRSEVIIMLGNHDLTTVVRKAPCDWFYNQFVSKIANRFFGSYMLRRQALLPFYNASPYVLISLHNGYEKEIAFVHGSLHSDNESNHYENFTPAMERFQEAIDSKKAKLEDFLRDEYLPNPNPCDRYGAGQTPSGPLWSRLYSENPDGVCDKVQDTGYKCIVVGHCPTSFQTTTVNSRFQTLMTTQPETYANCDNGPPEDDVKLTGCVMMDCESHGTKLVFVDVGMSKAQRTPTNEIHNAHRHVQILRLTHDPRIDSDMYFQTMEGVGTDGRTVLLYGKSTNSNTLGGKRTLKKRNLRKKKSLRRKTNNK